MPKRVLIKYCESCGRTNTGQAFVLEEPVYRLLITLISQLQETLLAEYNDTNQSYIIDNNGDIHTYHGYCNDCDNK